MNQNSCKTFSIARPGIAIPIVILVSGIVFFWALGEAAYWDRDEPRNAGCAAEMMARGDWIVPTFNDELRQQKPALLYWLMGLAYSIFGVNEFAGRFFSALLGVGTVIGTWGITRSFFDRATALLASLMLASSLMFCVAARAATPDSVLIFCVTMALWFFASGFARRTGEGDDSTDAETSAAGQGNPFSNRTIFFGIYIFLGLAMLAKGPVGFVLPMAVMGWFLLQRDWLRNDQFADDHNTDRGWSSIAVAVVAPFHRARFWRTLLSMRVLSGTLVALLVAAPWFVAVGIATDGEFLRRFFLDENFGRATKVLESHSGGLWFYPLAILVGFFPWSVFWGPVAADLTLRTFKPDSGRAKPGLDAGSRFAICWIVIQVVAFSFVRTKLPSYVTPCYPALAMLTAHAMMRLVRSHSKSPTWLWSLANGAMLLTGVGIVIGLWIASSEYAPIPGWLAVVGAGPILLGIVGWVLTRSQATETRFHLAIGAAVVAGMFCVGLLGAGAASVGQQNRMALADLIRQQPPAAVATYGCLESSWVYYSGTRIIELRTDGQEETDADQKLAGRKFWQRKPWLSPRQFAGSSESGLIITTDEKWPELKKRLPEDWKVIQTADWFLKDRKLLLIGARDSLASIPKGAEQVPAKQRALR
ncbi:ArnT family glycosyltransferase [Mariniblastus fucicola]|uniref:Undecaprenyl phosphate-alpha-4-amino-4-deoxy-L-arabinose arabinosyl transferase n=1 Tax=Mariniblastus fucicola TaxID=980251 RepID=A0A5B9P8C7_9BACT|nr:glycosyltransferase family 39 protein [Mariniblastus fucicola]QEG21120.1 Undecaprenyl phosphate-alpha-4-amino-4-deoxy-L-arabinose arabinosyl transferase [Mariniblastus fucicola]